MPKKNRRRRRCKSAKPTTLEKICQDSSAGSSGNVQIATEVVTEVAKPTPFEKNCRAVSKSYNHKSTPAFEEVLNKLLEAGARMQDIVDDPRALRLCVRLDPRPPPDPKESFTHFLGHVVLHKFPTQLRREMHHTVLNFAGGHSVQCQFPSLAHWCMFAYNKKWRSHWEHLLGAPNIPLPDKYVLGVGKYIGSWADAADTDDED